MLPPVEDLAVHVPPLQLEDSLAKAAEALRVSPTRIVPVAQNGQLVALLRPADLADVLNGGAGAVGRMPVSSVAPGPCVVLPGALRSDEALLRLRRLGAEAAAVVDQGGGYLGMVGTGELLSALCGRVRPPTIGGLATPFGVYLTTGTVRAGVGDLGLASTGVFTALIYHLAERGGQLLATPGGWLERALPAEPLGFTLAGVLGALIFVLLFRFSWVAAYHAAEHQTVHAIEQGEDLLPEVVRRKPRVHPRCGTNLVVALLLLVQHYTFHMANGLTAGSLTWVLGLLFVVLFYRRIGALAQQFITTRPAGDHHLRSGIRAGEQLLARYQVTMGRDVGLATRLWNIGLLQVIAGFMLTSVLIQIAF